jgi:HlyD family secretion protein
MYGSAMIPLERADDVVAVPRDAIISRGDKRVAIRIDNDTLREVPVTEGLTDGRLVQIAAGLEAGDTILSDARQDIAPGTKVTPIIAK